MSEEKNPETVTKESTDGMVEKAMKRQIETVVVG